MNRKNKPQQDFKSLLEKYLKIKGLDIIVKLKNGNTVELYKNRILEQNEIVMQNSFNETVRIPLSNVDSIDLFAA